MSRPQITLDHIPEEHLRGIGLVALAWSYLEGAVERVIWRLARLNDHRGQAMTTHMSMPARVNAMNALASHEFPSENQTAELEKIGNHIIKNLAPKRNGIVHSRVIHFENMEFSLRVHYKARGKLEKSTDPIDLKEYQETATAILKTASDLRSITAQLYRLIEKKDGALPP
jgi:hypothetical protein